MALWTVTPEWKKSVIELNHWVLPDTNKRIVQEIGWRWGEFTVETQGDEEPTIDEDTDLFCCEDFEVVDWSTDDGCWEDNSFYGFSEEEQEQMEEFLSENSIFDLEEQGWCSDDCEMFINCDVSIKKVEE